MNALVGEVGHALPRAAQSLQAPAFVQRRQECFCQWKAYFAQQDQKSN